MLEASSVAGGCVRTETEDGFRLDRGFQVLLTAYPQTKHVLDWRKLHLKNFRAGALVRTRNKFYALADPTRHPTQAFNTLINPVTTFGDKLRVVALRNRVCWTSLKKVLERPEVTTYQRLKELGFSDKIIVQFFKPFLGGIFLETDLSTSSRKFEFVFRMFALGRAVLPALGMGAIPQQLADRLKPGVLRTNNAVTSLTDSGVQLGSGETIEARRTIIAVNHANAMQLLNRPVERKFTSTTCFYYAAPRSPVKGPWLVLNGEASGPINNLCVPSEVQRSYAPRNTSLISVSVIDPVYQQRSDLELLVREQLTAWYGKRVSEWRHLRTFQIPQAFVLQEPPYLTPVEKPVRLSEGLFLCGDYTDIASIEGAIISGLRAAEAVST